MLNIQPGLHDYSVIINQKRLAFQLAYKPDATALVVFFHGLACSRDSFRDVFARPYFPDMSLLLPDFIGFGRSAKPDEFSYTMEAQAVLCDQLLAFFPANQIHIVAHSMGNAIALLLSPEVLARVQSFANLEGNLIAEDCGLLSRGISNALFHAYQTRLFNDHLSQFAGHAQLHFDQTTPTAVYKSAQSLVRWSDSGELMTRFKNLRCKKSYFLGEENHQMPVLQQLDFVDQYVIPQSGHGMMTDNPKAFYATLAEFIYS